MTDDEKCRTCAYFLHHYDGFCDLRKIMTNPDICSCAYWTKNRIKGLGE